MLSDEIEIPASIIQTTPPIKSVVDFNFLHAVFFLVLGIW